MATPTAIKKARERYSGILATFFANIDRHQGDERRPAQLFSRDYGKGAEAWRNLDPCMIEF